MSDNNMLERLQRTEKGQMRYGRNRQESPHLKDPRSFIEIHAKTFSLSDTLVVLENCEESAFVDENNAEKERQAESFTEKSTKSFEDAKERQEPVKVIDIDQNVGQLVTYIQVTTKKRTENSVSSKIRLFEDASKKMFENAQVKYAQLQERRRDKNAALQETLQRYVRDSEETANQLKQQNIEQHKSRSKILLTRIEEAENRRKLKLQQGRERLQNGEMVLTKLTELQGMFLREINSNRNESSASSKDLQTLEESFHGVYLAAFKTMESCRNKETMETKELNDLAIAYEQLQQLTQQLVVLLEHFRLLEEKKEQERQELVKMQQAKAEEVLKVQQAQKEKELANQNPESACPNLPKELSLSVSRAAYHQYTEMKNVLEDYETRKKRFTSDKSNSKLIIAINKAISVPLSSITNRSGSDIKNKISDLNSVLKGENIKVQSQLVKLDEDGLSYIRLTMAQKFVKQAEGQVSSNHSAAFCLALAVIGVWSNNSDFGKLFLAQLQLRCPFVIPWYVPQLPGQSDVEYNKKRGYIYADDGSVEKQDKYLSRMSGLTRTYAAVIQSPLPPDVNQHPHGVAEGWKWIARMLNLDPWPDVTATVLFDFVEVAGHVMLKIYGKQFEKLLYALCHDYYPKIEEVSDGTGGPLQRLQMFLKECIKKKKVAEPDGYLSDRFWNTYHHTGVVGS